MRYWWVNQNQTFDHEVGGGYLWSPKRNANKARNPFYEFMREVAPGDLVLSFQGTFIRAIGVAQSPAYESPKPAEFGGAGPNWDTIGWRVDVRYHRLTHQIRPADHMKDIAPALPRKYSPLLKDGRGLQSVYLTSIPDDLMKVLAEKIGREASALMEISRIEDLDLDVRRDGLVEWEEHLRETLERHETIPATVREQIVLARRGRGRFKQNVYQIEKQCRITRVQRLEHLRASHILPWRDCPTNESRLDGENGLLLTPTVDHLFDRGFISFEDDGRLLVSPVAHRGSLRRMGIPEAGTRSYPPFTAGQRRYLELHRDAVFWRPLGARDRQTHKSFSARFSAEVRDKLEAQQKNGMRWLQAATARETRSVAFDCVICPLLVVDRDVAQSLHVMWRGWLYNKDLHGTSVVRFLAGHDGMIYRGGRAVCARRADT